VALDAGDAAACAELAAEMRAHRPAAPAAQPEADGAMLSFRGAVQPPPPAHPARAVALACLLSHASFRDDDDTLLSVLSLAARNGHLDVVDLPSPPVAGAWRRGAAGCGCGGGGG